ncbi:4,5-DOPA dioxygenase extradiol [Elizabethkingia argentiflava]|uniref:4,5-DOPA dioxygenase extradiol n=1 Tax=Elizabethkingia argenteiflava TaxID=2681556 RepID=A0A845PV51_9FLAO|nr:4,5-DOPA dioxygenase extradiol [Elizabethkingia argenteiflava]NAW50861.1 4,5-DOPA dioxygenase extradiol [Elizabethkingia argenteiflava]
MQINRLQSFSATLPHTDKMPVLFLGHGSPMNAIEENNFVKEWRKTGQSLPTPKAIICISAHWETRGTRVTSVSHPKTIHDFKGFPPALFDVQYPAPGAPDLAKELSDSLNETTIELDKTWGLDHGAWSVIKALFPAAEVPIIELSIDIHKSPKEHYELAKELQYLRYKGVLIIGSGNIVHNLRMMDWQKPDLDYDWAIEANEDFKDALLDDRREKLFNFQCLSIHHQLSVPSLEHYLPSLYAYALRDERDDIRLFNDKLIYGSIGMLSFQIG